MTQTSPTGPYGNGDNATTDYRQQSREFLAKAREYLAVDDLHQASEKGWGAGAWMTKAVAEAQGWQYERHEQFFTVMYQAEDLTHDTRLGDLSPIANELHGYFYTRKRFLRPDVIGRRLDRVELLLNILEPLTKSGPGGVDR